MSAIKPEMKIDLRMEGTVNGHNFVIEGKGKGQPYDGTQTIDLEVTKGAPLPFAYDILTSAFEYGNRAFTRYPADIPDYFKQTFPEGYSWKRVMTYEDQGICVATSDIRMKGDCFFYNIRFDGMNFPPDGPVMQKKTLKWEPSTEKMYAHDGVLKGDVNMALLLEGGCHYRCDFKSTYKAKKSVRLPNYHFVDHRIEILSHDEHYNTVKLHEIAVARNSTLPSQAKSPFLNQVLFVEPVPSHGVTSEATHTTIWNLIQENARGARVVFGRLPIRRGTEADEGHELSLPSCRFFIHRFTLLTLLADAARINASGERSSHRLVPKLSWQLESNNSEATTWKRQRGKICYGGGFKKLAN